MKTVVGVDLAGAFEPALQLFRQLKFEGASMHFLNVVEHILPDGSFPELGVMHPIAQILDDLSKAGKVLLERTGGEWPGSTSQVAFGGAARCLVDCSDDQSADLLLVGSQEKSILESFFAGSVTKVLSTSCQKSVLIGKHAPRSTGGLTVVIAHDMSEYCDKALEEFIKWAPKGISRIILLTADTTDPSLVAVVERIEPSMAGETLDIIQSKINNRQAEIAERLSVLGARVELVVTPGSPKQAIHDAMKDSDADLLVLGAHGHGLLERLVVGSLALHEVVREPFNVLLMRA